ncbi:hypothetical protein ADUPG1_008527 [Aduncisulcus paluster]|uniref:Uncharacterized protein n=1 Tax=Aduncisulcus paluster TaxID=2918883 RepID=A0ABQ5KSA9_9EUKA|nr:hypothetical protein ADUPG1_008527 [Aduncisulcus paluster]
MTSSFLKTKALLQKIAPDPAIGGPKPETMIHSWKSNPHHNLLHLAGRNRIYAFRPDLDEEHGKRVAQRKKKEEKAEIEKRQRLLANRAVLREKLHKKRESRVNLEVSIGTPRTLRAYRLASQGNSRTAVRCKPSIPPRAFTAPLGPINRTKSSRDVSTDDTRDSHRDDRLPLTVGHDHQGYEYIEEDGRMVGMYEQDNRTMATTMAGRTDGAGNDYDEGFEEDEGEEMRKLRASKYRYDSRSRLFSASSDGSSSPSHRSTGGSARARMERTGEQGSGLAHRTTDQQHQYGSSSSSSSSSSASIHSSAYPTIQLEPSPYEIELELRQLKRAAEYERQDRVRESLRGDFYHRQALRAMLSQKAGQGLTQEEEKQVVKFLDFTHRVDMRPLTTGSMVESPTATTGTLGDVIKYPSKSMNYSHSLGNNAIGSIGIGSCDVGGDRSCRTTDQQHHHKPSSNTSYIASTLTSTAPAPAVGSPKEGGRRMGSGLSQTYSGTVPVITRTSPRTGSMHGQRGAAGAGGGAGGGGVSAQRLSQGDLFLARGNSNGGNGRGIVVEEDLEGGLERDAALEHEDSALHSTSALSRGIEKLFSAKIPPDPTSIKCAPIRNRTPQYGQVRKNAKIIVERRSRGDLPCSAGRSIQSRRHARACYGHVISEWGEKKEKEKARKSEEMMKLAKIEQERRRKYLMEKEESERELKESIKEFEDRLMLRRINDGARLDYEGVSGIGTDL